MSYQLLSWMQVANHLLGMRFLISTSSERGYSKNRRWSMMSIQTVPYWQGVHVMQDSVCDVYEKLEIHFEWNLLPYALDPTGLAHSFLHTFKQSWEWSIYFHKFRDFNCVVKNAVKERRLVLPSPVFPVNDFFFKKWVASTIIPVLTPLFPPVNVKAQFVHVSKRYFRCKICLLRILQAVFLQGSLKENISLGNSVWRCVLDLSGSVLNRRIP